METNPHPGEKGSELEDVLRQFLNQHLPQRFRSASGVLIDAANNRSKQTDVIVYDALSSPIYRASERLQILPAHTAAAVIEVKSSLNSATLRDGYEKIRSCKQLKYEPMRSMDRSATTTNLDLTRPLGVIFAFSSELSLETTGIKMGELNGEFHSDHWPDLVVVLDRGFVNYGMGPPGLSAPINWVGARAPAEVGGRYPPPFYVRVLVQETGDATLSHFFLMILAQLTFFPLRAGLPDFDLILGRGLGQSMVLDAYQFDLNNGLQAVPRELQGVPRPPEATIEVTDPAGAKIGILEYGQWLEDAGFVWWHGRIPLAIILKAVLGDVDRVSTYQDMGRPGVEHSSLLPITSHEFRLWPVHIAANSNLIARLAN